MFDVGKLIRGFNIFNGEALGKMIFYGIIAAIVAAVSLGLYHKITQTTESQTAEHITNVEVGKEESAAFFLGIKLGDLKLGVEL